MKSKSGVASLLAMNRKPWICDGCGDAFIDTYQHLNPTTGETCGATSEDFHRRRVFINSQSDWLDDEVPIEWLAEGLDTIRRCPDLTIILCSKRWKNFHSRLMRAWRSGTHEESEQALLWVANWENGVAIPTNIIGLCSVEDQTRADKRLEGFLAIPLACHGLSIEPLLGPINLDITKAVPIIDPEYGDQHEYYEANRGIDWIIIGGESGPNARLCDVGWIRSLVKQGQDAGIPVFSKQLGSYPVINDGCETHLWIADKSGADPDEWPIDLRVRQWPKGF